MAGRYHCMVGVCPEGFRGTDRGVFESVPFDPDTFFEGVLARADPAAVRASEERLRRRLPVHPLTRSALEGLLDDAVRHARGPVPLPIYDPSSSGYAGR